MTKINREQVYKKYNGHCAYCGREIKIKEMQVDHLEAKANTRAIGKDMDGKYIYPDINRFDNLMPSCRRCNHYKRAERLETFRHQIKTLHERIKKFYIVKVAIDFGLIDFKEWDGLFYFEKLTPPKD
jgi:5-methylcytosine-specific restriction endonuclease McrA